MILVTGDRGFIGTNLKPKLKGVVGFDRGDNFPGFKVDKVVHLAADALAYDSVKNPSFYENNTKVCFDTLEYMRKMGVKKMLFTSSREVYSCLNPYGASKVACEALIQSYCNCYGMGATILRMANIYGKGNLGCRFIETVIEKAKKNEDITIFGGEQKVMNFVHVDDCTDIIASELDKIVEGGVGVYDLASPQSHSLTYVADLIVKKLGSKSKILSAPNRTGETMSYIPKVISFPTKINIEKGIELCL